MEAEARQTPEQIEIERAWRDFAERCEWHCLYGEPHGPQCLERRAALVETEAAFSKPIHSPVAEGQKALAEARPEALRLFHGVNMGMLGPDEIAWALAAAESQGRAEEREACALIAGNPYGDAVEAYGFDEPKAVGAKIAAAIRARAGAPAPNGSDPEKGAPK